MNDVNSLAEEFKISPVIIKILQNRDISNREEIEKFLFPNLSYLSDPFQIPGVKDACERVCKSFSEGEKIFIYGDGDIDGICSVFLLLRLCEEAGADFSWYLTHRLEDYEIEEDLIENLKRDGYSLLITADCGISSTRALKKASDMGIQVIVLDHHKGDRSQLPDSHIYVNPSICEVPKSLRYLSGVGVVFKFLQGMTAFLPGIREKEICDFIEVVALGTAGDSVSLTGENRIFIKEGIERLSSTNILGLRILLEKLKMNFHCTYKNILFKINPKLNAPGRFGKPEVSLRLFLSRDEKEILYIIKEIEMLDRKRYSITSKALQKVEKEIEEKQGFIVMDDFPPSLCGIIASRCLEKYKIPVLACSRNGDTIQGSARIYRGGDIYGILKSMNKYFISFGGHSQAVGVKFKEENLNIIREFWNEATKGVSYREDSWNFDEKVEINNLTPSLIKEITALKPFGPGNPEPVFLGEDVSVQKIIKEENNLKKFWIRKNEAFFECVAKNDEKSKCLTPDKKINILYSPRFRENNGLYRIWLGIKDFQEI